MSGAHLEPTAQASAHFSKAWPLPYELTLEIALILARPYIGKTQFGSPPALHKFRLVCKVFGRVGKQAITVITGDPAKCPYTTICLPPKKLSFKKLVKMFSADGGTLSKLITTVCITLVPSNVSVNVSGPFNSVLRTIKDTGGI